jgi:hypothetical protein
MTHPHPKYHVVVKQRIAISGGNITIPVVYLKNGDKVTRVQVLIEYFLDNSGRSQQWMRYRARAFGYFFDYCCSLNSITTHLNSHNIHRKILRGFLLSLLNGTINHEDASDPLKLYWTPTSFDIVKRLSKALNDIVDYSLESGLINENLISRKSSTIPQSEPTSIKFLYVANKIKKHSFLSHLVNAEHLAKRLNRKAKLHPHFLKPPPNKGQLAPKRFPEELVAPLFNYGFIKDENAINLEDREDITAKMICLLLFFGGLRETEPLHIWINDIAPVDGYGFKVIQRHPSDALTYIAGENITRNEYLRKIGRLPRNLEYSKSRKAGWKNLALDDNNQALVYFIHEGAEELFVQMYNYYINEYRPKRMEVLTKNNKIQHPFLFVSSGVDRNSGKSYIGEPYSASALRDAFDSALNRVEKKLGICIPRGRHNNTHPHSARHFYIGKLKDAGVEPKIIQLSVKHGSIESQNAYDLPTQERVQQVMDTVKLKSNLDLGDKIER